MKRSVTEIIQRGFQNTVANWQLVLISIGEGIVLLIIIAVAAIAAIIPMAISLGLNQIDLEAPGEMAELILQLVIDQWVLIVYLILLVTIIAIVWISIHAFVEAGNARIFVDAERANSANALPAREQFRFFTGDRWFEGAKKFWWPVFWIYNATWGIGLMFVLLPLLLIALLMLLLRESPAAALGVGCLGLIVFFFVALGATIITHIWCQKAIVVAVARNSGPAAAMSASWAEFKADMSRHVGVTIILFILMIVGGGVLSTFSTGLGWHDSAAFNLTILPMYVFSQLASTVFSSFMTAWFIACFAALSVEARR